MFSVTIPAMKLKLMEIDTASYWYPAKPSLFIPNLFTNAVIEVCPQNIYKLAKVALKYAASEMDLFNP